MRIKVLLIKMKISKRSIATATLDNFGMRVLIVFIYALCGCSNFSHADNQAKKTAPNITIYTVDECQVAGPLRKSKNCEAGGQALIDNQVALLVQALASFGAPAGVDGGWTEEQREALAPVLTTYWKATP